MGAGTNSASAGSNLPTWSEAPVKHNRLVYVQALRAVAVLLVIAYHIANHAFVINNVKSWFDPARHFGFAGVDLFFVISGFIMIHTSWHAAGRSEERRYFIWRRLTRIYPLYWIVWIGSGLLIFLLGSKACYQSDVLLNHLKSFFLLPSRQSHCFITQAWTLNYEVYFYLLFSIIFFLPLRLALFCSTAWVIYSLTTTFFLPNLGPKELLLLNGVNLYFLLGCLIGCLPRSLLQRLAWPAVVVGVSHFVLGAFLVATDSVRIGSIANRFSLFGVSAGFLLAGAIGLEARGFLRPPAWFIRIGDASYSLYLTHLAIIIAIDKVVRAVVPSLTSSFLWVLATFFVSLAAGLGLYRSVERPMMLWLRQMKPR